MAALGRPSGRRSIATLLLLCCASFASVSRADPLSDDNGRRAQAIAESMVSPFCPATTLAYCSSQNAADWRIEIRKWVDEGVSDQEICRRMEARVGHPLCGGRPRSFLGSGFPVLVSIAIVGVLALVLRRFLRGANRADPGGSPTERDAEGSANDPELDARLDRELSRLEDD